MNKAPIVIAIVVVMLIIVVGVIMYNKSKTTSVVVVPASAAPVLRVLSTVPNATTSDQTTKILFGDNLGDWAAGATDWTSECNTISDDYVTGIYGRYGISALGPNVLGSLRLKCKSGNPTSTGLKGNPDRTDLTAYNQTCDSGFDRIIVNSGHAVDGLTPYCGTTALQRMGGGGGGVYDVKCPPGQKIRKMMGKNSDNYVQQIGFVCA